MSQIYKTVASTPSVSTSFQTQDGTAVPAANILIVNAYDTTENNVNGIETKGNTNGGNPPGTGATNEVDVYLTNRLQGITSTSGAATGTIITFTPSVVGTYSIEYRIAVYNETSTLGAGYSLFGAVRFDGLNSTICDTFDEIVNEEGAMTALDILVTVSGADIRLQGTGYLGQEINWSAVGIYTFIGVI